MKYKVNCTIEVTSSNKGSIRISSNEIIEIVDQFVRIERFNDGSKVFEKILKVQTSGGCIYLEDEIFNLLLSSKTIVEVKSDEV